jgi:hypothetical protein
MSEQPDPQESTSSGEDAATGDASGRIDRLLDAIELVKADRRHEAIVLLRQLIREDNDFEDAWMWMSVAVESLDQSSICLDNVLRINANNPAAVAALYRIRGAEIQKEKRRTRLRLYRELSFIAFWTLVLTLVYAMLLGYRG